MKETKGVDVIWKYTTPTPNPHPYPNNPDLPTTADDVIDTSKPRQTGRHFPDDIFKCSFWMKKCEFRLWLQFVP